MRSPLLTLIILALFLHPTYPQPRPPTWDSMMLALTWPPGYCTVNKETCERDRIKPDFTIHGLWPYSERGSMFMDRNAPLFDLGIIAADVQLIKELDLYWVGYDKGRTNVPLWRHEWEEHGRYAASLLGQKQYFEKTLQLFHAHNMTDVLARGSVSAGKVYGLKKARDEVSKVLSFKPDFICSAVPNPRDRNKKVNTLTEVRICFDYEGSKLKDCFHEDTSCHPRFRFPATA